MPAEPVLVVLPERAGLPEAAPLAGDLARALATCRPIRVDTASAQEVGLPILQLLVAAHRQAAHQGVRLDVTVPEGSALSATIAAHGFDGHRSRLRIEGGLWTGLRTAEVPR